MELADILRPSAVIARLVAPTKKQGLQELADAAAAECGQSGRVVFDVLLERERLGSTGVGHGVAIPHGKLPGLAGIHGLFARLAEPIDFESIDGRPVDLVFVLLAPENAGADHLKALARVSRLLRDPAMCDALRRAQDGAELYARLTETSTIKAA